jgi:hypothetical protein
MLTFSGNSLQVNHPVTIRGRGIANRHLSDRARVELALGLQSGAVRLEQLSLEQAAMITGASVSEVFKAKYSRNGSNGNGV